MLFSLTFAYPSRILQRVKLKDRQRVYEVLDAISVNILDQQAFDLVRDARRVRPAIQVRTHSYFGGTFALGPTHGGAQAPTPDLQGASFTTLTQARERGRRDAMAAIMAGALAHEQNGEAGLYRGRVRERDANGVPTKWHARADVAQLDDAYLEGWVEVVNREMLKGTASAAPELWDLGFGKPKAYYPNVPSRSKDFLAMVACRSLMAYGTDDDRGLAINLKYYEGLLDAVESESDLPINLVPGVGRVQRPGLVVGSDEALLELAKRARPRLREVSGYVGAGAEGQLVEGNPEFEAIVTLWPKLRRLAAEAAARTTKGASA